MNETNVASFFGGSPKKKLFTALAIAGIVLLAAGALAGGMSGSAGSAEKSRTDEAGADGEDILAYSKALEERIVSLCEEVEGVSDVSVLLTLDGGPERVYAENGDGGSCVVISVGGEEKVVLVREIYSTVRGIAVVCRGGDKVGVQKKLTELLSCALGVPISKISVAGAG